MRRSNTDVNTIKKAVEKASDAFEITSDDIRSEVSAYKKQLIHDGILKLAGIQEERGWSHQVTYKFPSNSLFLKKLDPVITATVKHIVEDLQLQETWRPNKRQEKALREAFDDAVMDGLMDAARKAGEDAVAKLLNGVLGGNLNELAEAIVKSAMDKAEAEKDRWR